MTSLGTPPTFCAPLRVEGTQILDSSGERVLLRGINLGSWLMMETWIPSLTWSWKEHLGRLAERHGVRGQLDQAFESIGKFDDDTMKIQDYVDQLLQSVQSTAPAESFDAFRKELEAKPLLFDATRLMRTLKAQYGEDGAKAVWDAFHQTWIAEIEFRRTSELGFNFVRIPFWFQWFEGAEPPHRPIDEGFRWLDKAFDWAEKYGLLILLDFHGAPGGQNPWEHSGELSRGELFSSASCLERTAAIWKRIAERYAGREALLGYNLLNEPFSARDVDDWTRVHGALYDAVRSADPAALVVMEDGYKLEDPEFMKSGFFPDPAKLGWRNVVYSIHFYETGPLEKHIQRCELIKAVGKKEQDRTGTPLYIGEFNPIQDTPDSLKALEHYLTEFNKLGWHWSPWTLKFTGGTEKKTLWGIYQLREPWDMPDPYVDDLKTFVEKIQKLSGERFTLHRDYAAALKKGLD